MIWGGMNSEGREEAGENKKTRLLKTMELGLAREVSRRNKSSKRSPLLVLDARISERFRNCAGLGARQGMARTVKELF